MTHETVWTRISLGRKEVPWKSGEVHHVIPDLGPWPGTSDRWWFAFTTVKGLSRSLNWIFWVAVPLSRDHGSTWMFAWIFFQDLEAHDQAFGTRNPASDSRSIRATGLSWEPSKTRVGSILLLLLHNHLSSEIFRSRCLQKLLPMNFPLNSDSISLRSWANIGVQSSLRNSSLVPVISQIWSKTFLFCHFFRQHISNNLNSRLLSYLHSDNINCQSAKWSDPSVESDMCATFPGFANTIHSSFSNFRKNLILFESFLFLLLYSLLLSLLRSWCQKRPVHTFSRLSKFLTKIVCSMILLFSLHFIMLFSFQNLAYLALSFTELVGTIPLSGRTIWWAVGHVTNQCIFPPTLWWQFTDSKIHQL